jgi:hypothetical protein
MADEAPTLRESIEAAGKEQGIVDESIEQPKAEEAKIEEAKPEPPDPEIEEAVNFYKALKDPTQQRVIIEELARRSGLLKPAEELTPKQEKKYTELIKEVLGTEYPDLEQRLSTVFSKFEQESDAKINQIKHELAQERQTKAVQEFDKEFSSFIKENKVSEDVATRMVKEIELLPPSMQGKLTLTQYMEKIHSLATMNQKKVDEVVKRNQKIEQNLKTRPQNLTGDVSEDRLRKGSKLPSIRESVQAAAQGIAFSED